MDLILIVNLFMLRQSIANLQSPSTDIKRIAIKREKSRLLLPLPFIFYPKMPPTRTPFKEISGNYIYKHNVSPYQRRVIAREARKGSIATEIAKDLNLDRETIRRTISLDHLRNEGKSLPKAARKLSYTPLNERHILHQVRRHLKSTYKEVKEACGIKCSTTTIKKILEYYSITNWRCKRRPLLIE